MSKIGKVFGFLANPLGIGAKKKKTVFLPIAPTKKAVEAQSSADEVAQRRLTTAARLRSGRVTTTAAARTKDEEEEELIKRAGARRSKLLGS